TSFQGIANILEIVRQSGCAVNPGTDEISGESWEVHEHRTGHVGVADPGKPTKIFTAHSVYAIKDKNSGHQVWACDATLMDFLQGRVRGTDHAYTNSAQEPFCLRCHTRRKGQHNMHWCVPEHSRELIQDADILEKTAQ